MDFTIKTIGEYDPDIENQVLPIADNDTYLKLKAGKKIPSNIKIGNKSVLSVLNNVNDVHFGGTFFLIALNSPFYYQLPYALGSESRVKFYIGRAGTSTAAQALLYCGTTPTTDQFSLRINATSRTIKDCYGTSIIDTGIVVEQDIVYDVDKNKNITTIRNCKTGEIYTITHPVQVFRSDKIACIGIMYQGTKDAPTFSENADSSWLAAGCEIYDYGKLLYRSHIVDNMTRFGITVGKTYYHQMNVHDTAYEDVNGNIQTITPCLFKLRNKTRTTDAAVLGIGKYLDTPVPAAGPLNLRNYTMMESLGFDVKDGSKYGYLDTGLVPNDFDGLYTFELKVKDYGKVGSYMGVDHNDSSVTGGKRRSGNLYAGSIGSLMVYLGSTAVKTISNVQNVIKTYKVQIHKSDGVNILYSLWVDNQLIIDNGVVAGSNFSNLPFYIFSTNANGSPNGYYTNIDVYHFKFWDKNGKLVFDGVPATGPYEDVGIPDHIYYGGLFNKVDGTFKPLKQTSPQGPI